MPRIKRFTGINNVLPAERARTSDLQVADNVMVTDTGAIRRRLGMSLLTGSSAIHSIFSTPENLFYVYNGELVRWETATDRAYSVATLSDGTTRMSYVLLNGIVTYSNGTDAGHFLADETVIEQFSASIPQFSTVPGSGTLPTGDYLVAVTGILEDGSETPVDVTTEVAVSTGGVAIWIFDPSDSRIETFAVYISAADGGAGMHGENMIRNGTVANSGGGLYSITSIDGADIDGQRLRTLNTQAMPACENLCFYRGRMYGSVGSNIIFSEPWRYEITVLDENHIPAGATVRSLVPVQNGIWVMTASEAYFMSGKNPHQNEGFEKVSVIGGECGANGVALDGDILNDRQFAAGKVAMWAATDGIFAGDANGQYKNLTADSFAPPSGVSSSDSAGVFDDEDAARYVFSDGTDLYSFNIANKAVTRYAQSVSDYCAHLGDEYFGKSEGLFVLDDTTYDTIIKGSPAYVSATITKNGIDFGDGYIKKITDLFLHMKSDGNLSITVTSEGATGTFTLVDGIDTFHGSKADLPRGVKGRNLSLSISNVTGSDFEINEWDIEVDVSRTRRGRQTSG